MWIRTCLVLHTLIGWIEDGVEDITFLEPEVDDRLDFMLHEDPLPPGVLDDLGHETPGWTFRWRLRDHAVREGQLSLSL
jgi:hypothetical protein